MATICTNVSILRPGRWLAVGTLIAAMVAIGPWGMAAVGAGVGDDPSDCDAAIVDTSGELDLAAVAAAVADEDQASVVIRGFDSVPDGDLVAVIDELVTECFVGSTRTVEPTLALLAFSVEDRQADVFLGRALPGGSTPEDLRDVMSARFPAGEFTEGVLDALDALALLVDEDLVIDDGTGERDTVAEPGDTNVGLLAAGGLGGLAVLGGGATTALLVSRRRKLNERRNQVAAALAGPQVRVGAIRERTQRADKQAELWTTLSAGRTLTVLADHRKQVRDASAGTERGATLLNQATPKGLAEASNTELEAASIRVAELTEVLEVHERALDALVALGARLDHLRIALPAKRELLFGELAAAEALSDQRHAEGWKVDGPEASLQNTRIELDSLQFNDLALDLLSLSERIEAAEAALFAADHDLQSLPDRPGAIIAWREKQMEAAELEERRAEQAIRRLAATTPLHAPESWNWASGNPDRALAHLRRGTELADRAMELARTEQRFEDAGAGLEQAGLELMAADELLDQVEDLLTDLDLALAQAPGILAETRRVLEDFARFVRSTSADLDPALVASPSQLDQALDGLELELATPRPNHLRVAQTGDRLNRELDDLMASAQQQHEEMEVLRRQAAREVARAERALLRAREALGWELFRSDDSRALDALEAELASLPEDPRSRLAEADRVADTVLAIQERIIARRRRNGNWVVVGGGSGGWASGGTWGGGGSGGGGGRTFGGGGGGISFGGGGGGRSFGGGRSSGSW